MEINLNNAYTHEVQFGTVKWFNQDKGFGFIQPNTSEEDIFVHISKVKNSQFESLEQGQKVEYTIGQGKRGPQAEDVSIRHKNH